MQSMFHFFQGYPLGPTTDKRALACYTKANKGSFEDVFEMSNVMIERDICSGRPFTEQLHTFLLNLDIPAK